MTKLHDEALRGTPTTEVDAGCTHLRWLHSMLVSLGEECMGEVGPDTLTWRGAREAHIW